MDWLSRLQRRFGRWYIPHLTEILMTGQGIAWAVMMFLYASFPSMLALTRDGLARGQVWRLVTFLFVPIGGTNVMFFLLGLYFLWIMGGALQSAWGQFRYNVYLFAGVLGCIAAALITGSADANWLFQTLFLAYAVLYPEHTMLLFFILPIPAKWLGWITGLEIFVFFVFGSVATKIQILLSMAGFFLFFGPQLFSGIRARIRREAWRRRNRSNWRR